MFKQHIIVFSKKRVPKVHVYAKPTVSRDNGAAVGVLMS